MTLVHPPLTGFPFALLTCAVICEAMSLLSNSAPWVSRRRLFFYAACIATPATYLSGYVGSEYANQSFTVSDEAIAAHQSAALFFVFSLYSALLLDLISRVRNAPVLLQISRLALILSFSLCIWTSLQGGQLVFSQGAAVNLNQELDQE